MGDPVTKMVTGLLPDGTLIRACEVTFEYFKKQEERIEQLEAALRKIACDGDPYDKCHCVNSDECSYGIARAALEGKDD